MAVIRLRNEYLCYCLLVGEVRFSRHRQVYEQSRGSIFHQVIAPENLSPQAHGLSRDEHRERVAILEQLFAIDVPKPDQWYHKPLNQIWELIETARKEGRRQVS